MAKDYVMWLLPRGLDANKPSPAQAGLFYIATDTGILYEDTGSAWVVRARNIAIQDEASALTNRPTLNFTGAGVTASDNSGASRTDVSIPGKVIQDEGADLAQRNTLNFIGAGVSAADNSGAGRTDVTISSSSITVQDEGSGLTQRPTLNFTGAGVTATDNSGSTRTDITIPGGGSSGYQIVQEEGTGLTQRTTVNFIGTNVTAVDNSGSTRTDVTVVDHFNATLDLSGNLTGARVTDSFIVPVAATIVQVDITATTVPVGANIVVDLMRATSTGGAGTSLYTTTGNRPSFATTATARSVPTTALPDTTSLAAKDVLWIKEVTAGSTTPGAGVVVNIRMKVN